MLDSPVAHNGLSNAMKSPPPPSPHPLPARSPCIKLNGSEGAQSARTDVIAFCGAAAAGWLMRPRHEKKSSRRQQRVTLGLDNSPPSFNPHRDEISFQDQEIQSRVFFPVITALNPLCSFL